MRCFYRYKKKRTSERQQMRGQESDCRIMAAELFSGVEEISPRDKGFISQQQSSSDSERKTSEELEAKRLSSVGAHCFGKDVDYVRVATPQCRVLVCPLVTASYAKDMGLIIPAHVCRPTEEWPARYHHT
jgi:hypothetical protein